MLFVHKEEVAVPTSFANYSCREGIVCGTRQDQGRCEAGDEIGDAKLQL